MLAVTVLGFVLVNFSLGLDIWDTFASDIFDSESELSGIHNIFKRATNTSGFNESQIQNIINLHNTYRGSESSSNMVYLGWNSEIAQNAQSHAEKCNFTHSHEIDRTNIGGYKLVGENLYGTTGGLDEKSVVKIWYDEKPNYHFDTRTCDPSKMCGHYTQVVWAKTKEIGCGYKFCPQLDTANMKNAFIIVCQYGPSGNYPEDPYIKGSACSICPANYTYCRGNLCATTSYAQPVVWPGHFALYAATIVISLCWFDKERFFNFLYGQFS